MQITGTSTLSAEKVERTIKTIEILFGNGRNAAKRKDSSIRDEIGSVPDIELYNNYSRRGRTAYSQGSNQTQATQPAAQSPTTASSTNDGGPDIKHSNPYECPIRKELEDILHSVFSKRAEESKRSNNPYGARNHAWQRYYDPSARHYVGGTLTSDERRAAFDAERQMIEHGRVFTFYAINPMMYGRGLGPSDPAIERNYPSNLHLSNALQQLHNRNAVALQMNDLFSRSGISVPVDLRLGFTINSQGHLHVTGTDDENLKKRIEDVLNSNGNSRQLYVHIMKSAKQPEGDYIRDIVPVDSYRMYYTDWYISHYTQYTRQDLDIVDGKFLTKDGVDILEHIYEGICREFNEGQAIGLLVKDAKQNLEWLARVGPENIPELILTIEYENGNLYDVGHPYGYGPGQTGWMNDFKDGYELEGDFYGQFVEKPLITQNGLLTKEGYIKQLLERMDEFSLARFVEVMFSNVKEKEPREPLLKDFRPERRDRREARDYSSPEYDYKQFSDKLLDSTANTHDMLTDALGSLSEHRLKEMIERLVNGVS